MTCKEIYQQGKMILTKAGNDSPAFDALCLFTQCFGMTRQQLAVHGDTHAPEDSCNSYLHQISQRAQGIPLQYLLGEWEFMGMPFWVGEGVLIPRDDTEVLVRECVRRQKNEFQPKILDLCGGSGAVAIGIASLLPNAALTSLELSETALQYLQKNAERNQMKNVVAMHGNVFCDAQKFAPASLDALVSNPPYIPTKDLNGLQIEVQKEPKMALDGGEDGLVFYRVIAEKWLDRLKPGGTVAVEVGIHQAPLVAQLFEQQGVKDVCMVKDSAGIDRVVSGVSRGAAF